MLVDFHVHSSASDGTLAPAELVSKAAGFAALALTDHDNTDGAAEFLSASGAAAERIAGVELSIEPGAGFDKFHLLGLGVDPDDEGLRNFLAGVLEGRNRRNARIIENFRALGIEMVEGLEDSRSIFAYAHGEVLARPHFARWLVDNGCADSPAAAFAGYLMPDSPAASRCYEERWHPPQEKAIAVIHRAGGVAVMAHPRYWRRCWRERGVDYAAAEKELARLKEAGLDGLECLYQANTAAENVEFTRIAGRIGLLKSAGSDFHGSNKPAIPLGMEVSEGFIAPLMERLRGRGA